MFTYPYDSTQPIGASAEKMVVCVVNTLNSHKYIKELDIRRMRNGDTYVYATTRRSWLRTYAFS